MIVAIGESVVAVGIGASELPVDASLVVLVVLGLAVSAGLWWTYFAREEEEDAVRAMAGVSGPGRVRMALQGFGYTHYVMLLGVILAAVGIEDAIAHPGERLDLPHALALTTGVSLFLLGDAWSRSVIGIGRTPWRTGTAAAVLLAIPVATEVSAAGGLGVTAALLAAALALEPTARAAT